MEKLRVLHLITDLGKGGAERYLLDLCAAWSRNPTIEFKIASLYNLNLHEEETSLFDVRYLDYKTFSLRNKNQNAKFHEILAEFKPHVIHTHRFLAEFLSSYSIDQSILYVCHGHDNMVQFNKVPFRFSKNWLIQYIEKRWLWNKKYKIVPTYFLANSKHTYDFFRLNVPKKQKENVTLFPLGFDYDKFLNNRERQIDPTKPIKLLNVGSFQQKKNQGFVIQICMELLKLNIPFEFHLVGDGPEYENVQSLVLESELTKYIHFHGIQHDVKAFYDDADIYIHTAIYEPFGLVLLEAMASGLPVITLNGKGNADIIEDGKNGFLINSQFPSLFADKINLIANDRVLYSSISNYGKKFSQQYAIPNKALELIDFYRDKLIRREAKSE